MDVYLGMDGVRTDAAGVATFRWIPSNINLLTFQASAKGFVSTQSLCKLAEQTPKLILQRPIKLKGEYLIRGQASTWNQSCGEWQYLRSIAHRSRGDRS